MPEHVQETTCNESSGLWLPLIEYSVKSGISLSTIRRKIKSNAIQYKLENGRYLIFSGQRKGIEQSTQSSPPATRHVAEPGQCQLAATAKTVGPCVPAESNVDTLPAVERSVSMVSEAFEHALREKEKRVRLLETRNAELQERLEELRLLVQVLEEKYEVRY